MFEKLLDFQGINCFPRFLYKLGFHRTRGSNLRGNPKTQRKTLICDQRRIVTSSQEKINSQKIYNKAKSNNK